MPYPANPMISEAMPVELDPVYSTKCVNEPICPYMYEGPMNLNTDGRIEHGRGTVRLEWLPVRRLAFRWRSPPVKPVEFDTEFSSFCFAFAIEVGSRAIDSADLVVSCAGRVAEWQTLGT